MDVCALQACIACGGHKRALDTLKLELKMVSCHVNV